MEAEKTARHLKFVSNLTGGTILELTCLLTIPCALGYSRVLIDHLYPRVTSKIPPLIRDFLLIIAVFVLPVTLLSDYIFEVTVIACTTAILLFYHSRNGKFPPPLPEPLYAWRRVLRAYILLYTCVCIYAVDFPLFPRRLAKTEAHGVSLMDVGVGLISVSCGIANVPFVYFCRTSARSYASMSSVLMSTVILVLMGASRTVVVKLLGYPDHVTEYGVHWNFFITMAALRVSSSLLSEESRRTSLLLANAEGLVSLPGYFALYLWGMLLGFLVDVHLAEGVSSVKYKFLAVQEEESWLVYASQHPATLHFEKNCYH
ncbi:unnamed protein product [Dibothriocephalus latus]|uniref:Phosphatidylinositol-glycan biosynthesis class W protein n=1 Tax=Dibothriocephalus latus TaxID=60516 RepID=A0A3P7N2M2_DIBLA|nr:unnamed protein product [Dibothriocephalus latus]